MPTSRPPAPTCPSCRSPSRAGSTSPPDLKQELLEATSERVRLRRLCELLAAAAETVERQKEIAARAQTNGKVHPPG